MATRSGLPTRVGKARTVLAAALGTQSPLQRFLSKKERAMRKVIAELDAEQRSALLYVADLGTAIFSAALIVGLLRLVGDLL
jgi:hypothetical protein